MKIAQELIAITKEHHLSLSIANKAINASNLKDFDKISQVIILIKSSFTITFRNHFEFEEKYIFNLLSLQNFDIKKLIQEHKKLLKLAENISINNLLQFGKLLKSHTRFEDRELFPNLSAKDLLQIKVYE